MKPSQEKCTSDHDWFVIQIGQIFNKESYDEYEFEKPIISEKGYVGSPDLFFTTKPEKTGNVLTQRKLTTNMNIIEFKPNTKSITEAARQLKVYERYKYTLMYRLDAMIAETKLIMCTYEDLITEDIKKISNSLNIEIIGIKRKENKKTGLQKW